MTINNLKLDTLLSPCVIEEIKSRLIKHHELYDMKVSSTLWEEILHKSFLKCNLKSLWSAGGHQTGADIVCEEVKISCKSGVVQGKKIKKLIVSSSRTTKYKTLEEKKAFLDFQYEDVIFSLVRQNLQYRLFVYKKPVVSQLDWKEENGNWFATDLNTNNEFKILKDLSSQYWMFLNLENWHAWGINIYDL